MGSQILFCPRQQYCRLINRDNHKPSNAKCGVQIPGDDGDALACFPPADRENIAAGRRHCKGRSSEVLRRPQAVAGTYECLRQALQKLRSAAGDVPKVAPSSDTARRDERLFWVGLVASHETPTKGRTENQPGVKPATMVP